jgi:predicted RNA-binding protein with PUA-like domain
MVFGFQFLVFGSAGWAVPGPCRIHGSDIENPVSFCSGGCYWRSQVATLIEFRASSSFILVICRLGLESGSGPRQNGFHRNAKSVYPIHISGRRRPVVSKKSTSVRKPRYWLFKSEPESFSISALALAPRKTTFWSGVRNYQARNFLRDDIQVGDGVLFYHSNTQPMAIVGTATVVKAGYPDHTAFDPNDSHFDPKSNPDAPTWYMVDIQLGQIFEQPLTRDHLKTIAALKDMVLLQRGSRLSVQPVTPAEWKAVLQLAESG